MINPIGPPDHNDLALFKRRWGDRITLCGGVSTLIDRMTDDEMRAHLAGVVAVGRAGGRFFPRTESGIPPMAPERIRFYLETLKELRVQGYSPAPLHWPRRVLKKG